MKIDIENITLEDIGRFCKKEPKVSKSALSDGVMPDGKEICPFCEGSKVAPYTGGHKSQDCTECDKDGYISKVKLKEYGLEA